MNWLRNRRSSRRRGQLTSTISFSADAYESAADHFRQLAGWMVEVTTTDGVVFDAFIGEGPSWSYGDKDRDVIRVNEENGQYEVLLRRANEHSEPTDEGGWADIYDDLKKVVVY
jgi:hypothetical protein